HRDGVARCNVEHGAVWQIVKSQDGLHIGLNDVSDIEKVTAHRQISDFYSWRLRAAFNCGDLGSERRNDEFPRLPWPNMIERAQPDCTQALARHLANEDIGSRLA